MTLSLATPTGSITTLPSGIKIIRCADFLGAARGTLGTVSDSDSVSGTVVSETQTRPVQTTFASQGTMYNNVANTVVVPKTSIGVDTTASRYDVFIAAKMIGDVPANARAGMDWEKISNSGASAGFGWGTNSGFTDGPQAIARSKFSEYLIYSVGQWFFSSSTEFRIRGWGIAGGSVEMRFDLIYLTPFIFGPDFSDTILNSGTFGLPLQFNTNGVLYFDQDDDASTWIGSHSVNAFGFPWMQNGASDVQENDNEPTVIIEGFGDWTDDPTPKGHLAFIAGSTKPPPAETMLDDTFGYVDTVGQVDASQFWIVDGYLAGFNGNSIDNWYDSGGFNLWRGWVIRSGLPSCYFGANESATLPLHFGESRIAWGGDDNSSSADPRNYLEILSPLREGIFEGAFRFSVLQEAYGFVGLDSLQDGDVRAGGAIELDGSGNVKVSVRLISRTSGIQEIMDEASVLTGVTTSSLVRIKAERRVFTWRAKAWLDGTTEPDWQVEGVEPIVARSSLGVYSLVSHPWDVNWAASIDNDTLIYDPRRIPSNSPSLMPVAVAAVGPGLSQIKIDLEQFIVSFDPGAGTPGDMSVKVVKYDGSTILDPTITIPYGSHRFVVGSSKQRRFNTDNDAYQIWGWKSEAGEPDLEFASIGSIWELRDRIVANLLTFNKIVPIR